MAHPARLQAEVNHLLPQGYWATTTMFGESGFGSTQVDIHMRSGGRPFPSRPVIRLVVGEYYRHDQFDTVRHIRGRLITVHHLDWHDFPTLEAAVASLTTQHRLGVGNA